MCRHNYASLWKPSEMANEFKSVLDRMAKDSDGRWLTKHNVEASLNLYVSYTSDECLISAAMQIMKRRGWIRWRPSYRRWENMLWRPKPLDISGLLPTVQGGTRDDKDDDTDSLGDARGGSTGCNERDLG